MKIKIYHSIFLAGLCCLGIACQNKQSKKAETSPETYKAGTFGNDLDFLQKHDSVLVLKNSTGKGQIIVSAKYQGKVFTSTANGLTGKSFGWINYKAFGGKPDPHMNAYGGENRLWLGPEGNKFSLFFKPGSKMEFANWVTPAAIDTEPWTIVSQDSQKVSLQKTAAFVNYSGTTLNTRIDRIVQILENSSIEKALGVTIKPEVQSVGFTTENNIANTGKQEWNTTTGAPCLWVLDMFNPSPNTVIVIPYVNQGTTKVATTNYFGEIPTERVKYNNGILFFKADGKARGKLGLAPDRAKPMAGSYDSQNNILTIIIFNVSKNATYLNQEWATTSDPLKGDAVNAYNDGPLADGTQMGPFYELESVSPAAFLKPGQSLTHQHSVFHFTGDTAALNQIAKKVLGSSLASIQTAFK